MVIREQKNEIRRLEDANKENEQKMIRLIDQIRQVINPYRIHEKTEGLILDENIADRICSEVTECFGSYCTMKL